MAANGAGRRTAAAVVLVAAMVASVVAWAMPTPAVASSSGSTFVGLSSHTFWMSESDVRSEMSALASGGVRWVREDFRWDVLEPTKGSFDWRRSDAVMAGTAAAGVNVLAILTYSAKWASSDPSGGGSSYFPPTHVADYASYARAVVSRYGAGGTFWSERPDLPVRPLTAVELWNEPWGWWNWRSGVDPVGYAALARAGAEAVKAVDPATTVLLAGDLLQVRTDGAIVAWLDNVLQADPGLVSLIDAYSVHPYPYPREQGPLVEHEDKRWDYGRITLIRDVTVARSAAKPIWITEIGWSTADTTDSVTETQQAEFTRDAVLRAAEEWPYVDRIFPYTWTKDRPDTTDREANYGVRRSDGTYKPSWHALVEAIQLTMDSTTTTTTESTTTTTESTTTTTEATTTTTTTTTFEPVADITLEARLYKQKGLHHVELTWSGAEGAQVEVKRLGEATVWVDNRGRYVDSTGQKGKAAYEYRVCETAGGACSPIVIVTG